LFLIGIMIFSGLSEVIVRDMGLIGGFISLMLWPRQRFR